MTQEEKQLLFKDLCARLPYKVQCYIKHIHHLSGWIDEGDVILTGFRQDEFTKETEPLFCNPGENPKIVFPFDSVKPYLRPMSSMTQEEIDEYDSELDKDLDIVMNGALDKDRHITSDGKHNFSKNFVAHFGNDWLNKNMFDYRGLIEKELALEAPKGMYK